MQFQKCDVNDACMILPSPHLDERGRFMRAWCQKEFEDQGINFSPVQANMAYSSKKGTMRGLHYQVAPALEAKLVRCTRGSVFDLVADLRPDSSTYLKWFGTELSAENGNMLFVPEGCAHGCLSLEDNTEILYLTSAFYAPQCARGVRYDDPGLAIKWPENVVIVSEQDRNWPLINN
jgi:dTDP-4-dehydrorhamnose 3,5-epimerase